MLDTTQWQFVTTYLGAAYSLKQDDKLPDYILALTKGTLAYEQAIKAAWIDFKRNPTETNAAKFAEFLKTYSGRHWPEVVKAVLGVPELSPQQQKMLEDALGEHHEYVMTSLLPDVLKAASADNLNAMDHRAIFLYAGALWSFGLLATVMFDGLEVRDLADLFLFAGPNDEATCTGERGCEQYAGKVFTVAQILAENIIPGRLRCVTNCRHMLLPIASPLNQPKLPKPVMDYGQWQSEFKHLAGRHDQKSHAPKVRVGNALRAKFDVSLDYIDPKASGYLLDGVDIVTKNGVKRGDTFSNEELTKLVAAGPVSMGATGMSIDASAAPTLKNNVVSDLSAATGLDYNRVNTMIAAWAATTNDNKPESLGLQQAASEQFDVPVTPWQQKRIDTVSSIARDNEYEARHFWRAVEEGKPLLKEMYDKTQHELKAEGIKSVVLYRGVVLKQSSAEGLEKGVDYPIHGNVMESWSLSEETAKGFAIGFGQSEKGLVFQAEVPIERILSTPKTGFGCLEEAEFVVLGSKEDDYARVVGVY